MEKLERKGLGGIRKSQMKAIKNMFNLLKTTPSWGLMKKCGLWPMRERVVYKRFMTFQQTMTSQNGRLCRKVIENKKKMGYKQCWYSEIKDDAEKYNVDINEATTVKIYKWKRIVKKKLKETIEKQSIEKEGKNTKLRHQRDQKYERQKYLGEVGIKTAREIIKTNLEMWAVGSNFGMERKCWCGEKESSEHVFECERVATEYMKGYLEKRKEYDEREELLKSLAPLTS